MQLDAAHRLASHLLSLSCSSQGSPAQALGRQSEVRVAEGVQINHVAMGDARRRAAQVDDLQSKDQGVVPEAADRFEASLQYQLVDLHAPAQAVQISTCRDGPAMAGDPSSFDRF